MLVALHQGFGLLLREKGRRRFAPPSRSAIMRFPQEHCGNETGGWMRPQVLIVDDEEHIRALCSEVIAGEGCDVVAVASGEEALEVAATQEFDAILTDIMMDRMDGLEALRQLKSMPTARDTPVIIMTGYATMQSVIEALRSGAYDYLPKPFDLGYLIHTVQRALELTRLKREVRWLREQVTGETDKGFGPFVGVSVPMRKLYDTLTQVAPLPTGCVLILGETGTGKGLVARMLHNLSSRASASFVHVNCSAVPADLFEAELFGHEPGAFTDARHRRIGHVEAAHRGTLFLDEIGDVPLALQAKLLHVIEEKTVQRLGAHQPEKVDVRIVAATNRDLGSLVQTGAFRQDLYYRLSTIPVLLPPLRERREDILPLSQHFLEFYNGEFNKTVHGLSPEAEQALLSHDWQGNVRELRNAIERAVLFETGSVLSVERLLLPLMSFPGVSSASAVSLSPLLSRERIEHTLASCGGNKSQAAKLLGVSRQTLYNKIQEFGM